MGDDFLPRLCIKGDGDRLFSGSGPCLDMFSKSRRTRIHVFKKEGSHVFGFHLTEKIIVAYGEHNLAVFEYPHDGLRELEVDECNLFRFSDSVLQVRLLPDNELVVLFTCNNLVKFHVQHVLGNVSLSKMEEIQSEHLSVLLNGLLVGDSWANLISIVGTVFGEILISKPSVGSTVHRKLTGHTGMIFGLLQIGNYICSISDDRSLRVWDFDSCLLRRNNDEVDCQFGHSARPFAICCEEDRGLIYTSGIDQTVCKWSLDETSGKLRLLQSFTVNIGCVRSLYVYDNKLYIGSENGGLLTLQIGDHPTSDSKILEACDDIRGFAVTSSEAIYTVDGRGRIYYGNGICWPELDVLRYLVSPPSHYGQSFALAYGDNQIVTLYKGKATRFTDVEYRILSVVCTDCHIFAYTVQQIGYLYNSAGMLLCRISMKGISTLMKKKKAMIPSTMNVLSTTEKQVLVVGTTSGHLLYTIIPGDNTEVEFTSKAEMTRHFKNSYIMAITSTKSVITILCKNGEVSKWKLTGDDSFLHVSSVSASDCISLDWPCSFYQYDGREYIGGFHSTNFHLVDVSSRLCLLTIPCGGGNRPWNFSIDRVNGCKIGKLIFIRDQLLVSASYELMDFGIIAQSLHRSQIVSIHSLGKTNIFCTLGTDNQLIISRFSADKKYKEIDILKRMADHVGFLSIDSFLSSSNSVTFVTGGNKGFLTLWELASVKGGDFEDDSLLEVAKVQHKSCTRVLDVQFLRDKTGTVIQPLVISAIYADGSIDVLMKANDRPSVLDCLATLQAPDLSLFTKAQFFESHDGRKLLVVVSTSGYCTAYVLSDNRLIILQSIFVAKCGLSCFHSLVKGDNVFAAVGDEAGAVHILQWTGEHISMMETIQYHAATVTAVELICAKDGFTALSTSLDCRLAEHAVKFTEELCVVEFIKSRCQSIWDPSSFITTGNHLVIVGSGVEVLDI